LRIARAGEQQRALAEELASMEFYHFIVSFFRDGGFFLYPLAIIFVVGVAISIERFTYLTIETAGNRRLWSQVVPLISAGNFKQVVAITSKSKSAIATALNYGIARLASARRRDDIEKAMDESLLEIIPRIEKRTHYLSALANIGMLTGLLGTVIGLISAFASIAQANPAEKASLLAASISVAMNNTASGLIVAITLLLSHMFLESKTTKLIDSLEIATVKFLNSVVERRQDDLGDEPAAPRGRTAHGVA
jgi:biopolymer transport protein ExbB